MGVGVREKLLCGVASVKPASSPDPQMGSGLALDGDRKSWRVEVGGGAPCPEHCVSL